MNTIRWTSVVLLGFCAVGMAGCRNGKGERDSQWFLAHGADLQEKLASCKAKPEAARTDRECAAATDAFLRWYEASGLAARQAQSDADQVDARLTPPASSQPLQHQDSRADVPSSTVASPGSGRTD